ncbi:protein O-GlcNAcase isoform X2 [Zootermopsis nevadensis]|uniref:protein O-GlcNAcase isoform X2 n=1 Tax=Zootermopsis nevadensis TaxID=136037 RepID=UPI000B8EB9E1|nr:protein O-GlcNAcase isoform X2 [Zootermopsis nevadensis]
MRNNLRCFVSRRVVEGNSYSSFYGRPWTTEQRKDLFQKLKKWGMESYLYAPKDDYKHRAYWRELYTVEEAEHLTGLISSARDNGITFYYALSPGLDITYSSTKEMTALKRKLEQVSQFGCTAYALLFDDIEPEMCEADKEVFQSFAYAQVSVSNEVFQHLGQPHFMLCPTQYCAARATPNVQNSEYLNTLGSKLAPEIDIMWTGPKVISRLLTIESIEEITDVLRRPPVIWDNLHANDYDQKRVFLGPYSGRSPDLIPKLRGVLTNPNCEYGANFVAIHTLAQWSRCNVDGKRDPSINDSVSADIKLETETEDGGVGEDVPSTLSPNMYHPRRALRNAINEWLEEFGRPKAAWGPIAKPQQLVAAAIPLPIISSINTCMSLTTTTTSCSSGSIPVVNSNQLQALAEVCSSVTSNNTDSMIQPGPGAVMNSLVSETKVICKDSSAASNPPIISGTSTTNISSSEPMDCNQTPPYSSPTHITKSSLEGGEDVSMAETVSSTAVTGTSMHGEQVHPTNNCTSSTMIVECTNVGNTSLQERTEIEQLTHEDLALLCDLFYLPFEHGGQGLQLLHEFNWLKGNAHLVMHANCTKRNVAAAQEAPNKPEVIEWLERAARLEDMSSALNRLFRRLTFCANRELLYDLYPYVWDVRGVVSLLNSYIKWLASGQYPHVMATFTLGSYTWFSKGWKETFMSGEQEPWVFRGGLTADLQRLIPVDSGNDLFIYKPPDVPSSKIYTIRPYLPVDETHIYDICRRTCMDGMDGTDCFRDCPDIVGDKFVGGFLTLTPEFCFVVEDDVGLVGYALAALDSKQFHKKLELSWIPEMCHKYPKPEKSSGETLSNTEDFRMWFHTLKGEVPESIHNQHPSVMCCSLLTNVFDQSVAKRLVTCLLAALRANGSFGVHVQVNSKDRYMIEFYGKLGFLELSPGLSPDTTYVGRAF